MPVRNTAILSSLWHLSIEFWNNLIYFSFNSHDSKLFSLKQISNVNFLCKILGIIISSWIYNVHAAKLLTARYLWSRRWCSRRWSCWWAPAAAARCPSPRPAAWSGPTRTPGRPSCVILQGESGQQHREYELSMKLKFRKVFTKLYAYYATMLNRRLNMVHLKLRWIEVWF